MTITMKKKVIGLNPRARSVYGNSVRMMKIMMFVANCCVSPIHPVCSSTEETHSPQQVWHIDTCKHQHNHTYTPALFLPVFRSQTKWWKCFLYKQCGPWPPRWGHHSVRRFSPRSTITCLYTHTHARMHATHWDSRNMLLWGGTKPLIIIMY